MKKKQIKGLGLAALDHEPAKQQCRGLVVSLFNVGRLRTNLDADLTDHTVD